MTATVLSNAASEKKKNLATPRAPAAMGSKVILLTLCHNTMNPQVILLATCSSTTTSFTKSKSISVPGGSGSGGSADL